MRTMLFSIMAVALFYMIPEAHADNLCRDQFRSTAKICVQDYTLGHGLLSCLHDARVQRRVCRQGLPKECRIEFRSNVKWCVKNLPRHEVRACVKEAREQRRACLNGDTGTGDQCATECNENHQMTVEQCQLDNNVDDCGGDPICEQDTQAALEACTAAADEDLNVCLETCGE